MKTMIILNKVMLVVTVVFLCDFKAVSQDNYYDRAPMKIGESDTNSFAIYFPKDYDSTILGKYPVILFLDPVAKGDYPISKYKDIADKYGIIFFGSFEFRNFKNETAFSILDDLYDKAISMRTVDPKRIILSGFSGSARAVSSYALLHYDIIAGVINCGAGFAGDNLVTGKNKIPFSSVVGYLDMNYEELIGIASYLDEIASPNSVFTFHGGHIWPPKNSYELAVYWQLSLQDSNLSVAPDFIPQLIESIRNKIDSGFLNEASIELAQLEKIRGISHLTSQIREDLNKNGKLLIDQLQYSQVLTSEREKMNSFLEEFAKLIENNHLGGTNHSKWKLLRDPFEENSKTGGRYIILSSERYKDLCYRTLGEYYNHFMEDTHEFAKAYNCAAILDLFNFVSIPAKLLQARAAAALNLTDTVLKLIKNSVKKENLHRDAYLKDEFLKKVIPISDLIKLIEN